MNTLLLTGFDVWGALALNSSWEMVREAARPVPAGWRVVRAQLPVSWGRAPRVLARHVSQGGHLPGAQDGLRAKWRKWGASHGCSSAEGFCEM